MGGKKPPRRGRGKALQNARRELRNMQNSIEHAYSVFNHTVDPDLLEASILELRALQSRYDHLLRNMKKQYGA